MEQDRLAKVDYVRSDVLTDAEKDKYGIEKDWKGLVAIETRMDRNSTIKEVEKLVKLYNNDKVKAYEYYEEEHCNTIDSAVQNQKFLSSCSNRKTDKEKISLNINIRPETLEDKDV